MSDSITLFYVILNAGNIYDVGETDSSSNRYYFINCYTFASKRQTIRLLDANSQHVNIVITSWYDGFWLQCCISATARYCSLLSTKFVCNENDLVPDGIYNWQDSERPHITVSLGSTPFAGFATASKYNIIVSACECALARGSTFCCWHKLWTPTITR